MIENLTRKEKKLIYHQLGFDPDPVWIERPAPNSQGKSRATDDWVRNFDRAYCRKDNEYVVLIGLENWPPYGQMAHLFIRQHYNQTVSWAEKQHLLHSLFGKGAKAFEVFPPVDELVDQATVYHLWVIDPAKMLPGLPEGLRK